MRLHRCLAEPLLTYDLHKNFINAAKLPDARERVNHIHFYVHELPADRRRLLQMIIEHLCK
jgi:hypothetical protein